MSETTTEMLRAKGLQVTAQRVAVLEAVSSASHATVDQITENVRMALGSVSRQAVYDALGVLVDHSLLRRIEPAGFPTLYEDRVGDNHHHLICRRCHAVKDIDCAVGRRPCLAASQNHGYTIDEAEVIYWGYCPSCADTISDQTAELASEEKG